jgi:uncharacterized protein (UPF0332 family)
VNRAYYALFGVTTAMLLTKRIERSKQAAFNQYFIKTRIIEIEYGKIFDYVRKKREEGDYTAKSTITAETAHRVVEDSKKFMKRIKGYLESLV